MSPSNTIKAIQQKRRWSSEKAAVASSSSKFLGKRTGTRIQVSYPSFLTQVTYPGIVTRFTNTQAKESRIGIQEQLQPKSKCRIQVRTSILHISSESTSTRVVISQNQIVSVAKCLQENLFADI